MRLANLIKNRPTPGRAFFVPVYGRGDGPLLVRIVLGGGCLFIIGGGILQCDDLYFRLTGRLMFDDEFAQHEIPVTRGPDLSPAANHRATLPTETP